MMFKEMLKGWRCFETDEETWLNLSMSIYQNEGDADG